MKRLLLSRIGFPLFFLLAPFAGAQVGTVHGTVPPDDRRPRTAEVVGAAA